MKHSSNSGRDALFLRGFRPALLRGGLACAAMLAWLSIASLAHAYFIPPPGAKWPGGEIRLTLLLGSANRTLEDGNTSWDQVAVDAANLWNAHLIPVRFSPSVSTGTPHQVDNKNEVFWSPTAYGMPLGNNVLAITLIWTSGKTITECDVIANTSFHWGSYRDARRNHGLTNDLQRVLLHEFGHVLGLDHPDDDGQHVTAVMNSVISDVNYLTPDDLAGVQALYGPDLTRPTVLIRSPANGARVPLPDITVTGLASDNALVQGVQYELNGGGFQNALTTNSARTINWSAMVALRPGSNIFTVKSVDTSTNESIPISRSFFFVVSNIVTLLANGAGIISPELNGLGLEIDRRYTVTALPSAGNVFSNWTGDLNSSLARLTFQMQSNLVLQANFVPNPFPPVKGTFTGLFRETGQVRYESSGSFTLRLTDRGTYTGKLLLAGKGHPFSGHFDLDGRATNHITRGTDSMLSLELSLDLSPNGTDRITGTLSDGVWLADLLANRSVFNAASNAAPWAGLYTLIIPGTTDPTAGPGGDGYGAVKVDAAGNVNLIGRLADGTTLAQRTPLSKNGAWPLYLSLYSNKGSLCSWVQFDPNLPATSLAGTLNWFKPATTKGLYAAGFTNQTELIGSSYSPPATKTDRVVAMADGVVVLSGGELNNSITDYVIVSQNNKVTSTNAGFTFAFTLSSGLFKGTLLNPATAKKISFAGALLQNSDSGSGYFALTNQSGRVLLQAGQ